MKIRIARIGAVKVMTFIALTMALTIAAWFYVSKFTLAEPVQTLRVDSQAKIAPLPELEFEEEQINELQSLVDSFLATQDAQFSIYIENLETGEIAEHSSTTPMITASLYKAFIANEAFKMVDDGNLSLKQVIDEEREFTAKKCLEIMITKSDNDCGVILQRLTGALGFLPQLSEQGFTDTDLRGFYPKSTASDVAQLFKNLYDGNYLSEKYNAQMLTLLNDQKINDRIPAKLPKKTIVAHKTGDLSGAIHDAGIVYTSKGNYAIVIMSQDWDVPDKKAYNVISELSLKVYESITE